MNAIQKAVAARHQAIRENEAKGFTLIELLVVVIIIGILAAIAIPVFLNQREAAWKASVESDVKNAVLAIETYAVNHNGAPPPTQNFTATGFITDGTAPTSTKVVVSPSNSLTYTRTGSTASATYTIVGTNTDLGSAKTYTYSSSSGGGVWAGL